MEKLKQILTKLRQPIVIIRLLGLFVFLNAVVIALLRYINQHSGQFENFTLIGDFYANAISELASIASTILVIDALNEWRQNRHLRERLTRDLLSNATDFAARAVDELREHGWLNDVLQKEKDNLLGAPFKGASLWNANLKDAFLRGANLENANLMFANLEEASLMEANLENAFLQEANLESTTLKYTNLKNANLFGANLKHAYLIGANLENANLDGADLGHALLKRANLKGVKKSTPEQLLKAYSLHEAIMPDGTKYEEWIKRYRTVSDGGNDPVKLLSQHVKDVSKNRGIHPNKIYSMLRKEFNVSSYKDIEEEHLEKALELVDNFEA